MTADKSIFQNNNTNLFAFRSHSQYINFYDLYLTYFNSIPNSIIENNIDCKKANDFFLEKHTNDFKEKFYIKTAYDDEKDSNLKEVYYVMNNIIIVFFMQQNKIYFLFSEKQSNKTQTIIHKLISFKKKKKKEHQEIRLLISSGNGIDITSLKITKPKLKIEDNYNNDFLETHKIISKRLTKKNDKGLVLLHGKPGTGKTSYIRYLITLSKKNVIFLPPNMASAITNPNLLSILIDNPNSIFVIEDAENIVIDREQNGTSAVSALLNLSDGLLSDCLNIQIICSFNTDLSKVDEALLRKGRLIAKYEFNELKVEKAQKLSNKLGFKTVILSPTKLTDIYNQTEKDFVVKKKVIGF